MALVTIREYSSVSGYTNITYDDDYINVSISGRYTIITFINDWNVKDDSNIILERDDRDTVYNVGVISTNSYISNPIVGWENSQYSQFEINVALGSTDNYYINVENANLVQPESEPEPEPEPDKYSIKFKEPFNIPDEYVVMYNGNDWEIDFMYDNNTGDYSEGYISYEVVIGESVEISVQSKQDFEIGYAELLDTHYNYYPLEGDENLKSTMFTPIMDEEITLDVNIIEPEPDPDPEPEPDPEPDPEPETKIVRATNNENVVIYFNGEVWEITEYYNDVSGNYEIGRQNKEVTENFNVIIEPIEGYIIGDNDNHYHYYDNLVFQYFNNDAGDYVTYEYEGDEYSQSLEYNFNWSDYFDVPTNRINLVVADRPDTGDFPYNKIYRMTETALNDLSSYSYVEEMQQSGYVFNDVVVNYGQYITGLYVFPYEITQGEETTVLLGTEETNVTGKHISDYIQNVDLGKILIPMNGTENVGYSNITIELYVPYFGNINLDVDEVLSNIISLNLKLNMLSGKGTLNVINTKTDTTIYSQTTQIGVKIPYEIADNVSVNIGSDVLETDYNVPYVEMKVLKPDNETKFKSVNKITIDDSYTFIKDSDDILLYTNATEREQRLIKDFISRGIFVRK